MKKIKSLILLFIGLLMLSGFTAFPIEWGLESLEVTVSWLPDPVRAWYYRILEGVRYNNAAYPFMAYGTDWLAFAHVVIGLFIWGAYLDPVKNIWVLKAALAACLLVFPLALIAGGVREIPVWWRLIDCSFGLFGALLLWRIFFLIGKEKAA